MGKITGFMEINRETPSRRPVGERLKDWREFDLKMPEDKLRAQGARCMDCGIPFCHKGCPLGNIIPDWNDLIYRGRWREAIDRLHATNNFPEFTGRICPAPCEEACVLNINNDPVTIKLIEKNIIDHAWAEKWIAPLPTRAKIGQARRGRGLGTSGARMRAATHARRAFGDALRALGSRRRIAHLRHPRLQAGKMDRQSARRADEGRGPRDRHQLPRRHRHPRRRDALEVRRDRAHDGRDQAARSADPGTRAEGNPFRDGFPAATEQAQLR